MWQISYTLSFILGKANRFGLCKVYLRYKTEKHDWWLYNDVIRIEKHQLRDADLREPVKNHPLATSYNGKLNKFRLDVETRLSAAVEEPTLDYLNGKVSSSDRVTDFIEEFVAAQRKINENSENVTSRGTKRAKGRFSKGRLRLYEVLAGKVAAFDKKATFKNVNVDWLKRFEAFLVTTDIGGTTLSSNMAVIKAIVGHAAAAKMLLKSQYEGYIPPEYEQEIPVFLEEHEIGSFHDIVVSIKDESLKTSGYYFLLACYAGYRISDLKQFNYYDKVKADYIVLRAEKNGNIVSIPLYGILPEILEYCRDHKLKVAEETMRKHVKDICRLAGIKAYKSVKVHSGRHSFAMRLTDRGVSKDDVAKLLGDSLKVAERYARIRNVPLANRVKLAMGE